jgi:hypothetical protein
MRLWSALTAGSDVIQRKSSRNESFLIFHYVFLINACASYTFCANKKIKYFLSLLLPWMNVEQKEDKIIYYLYCKIQTNS